MKVVKIVLGILLVVIAVPLITALFVKKDYAVSREIVISRPVSDVFSYIKQLKNQNYYSKWALMDPDMKKDYRGEDGVVGFVSAWDSQHEKVGAGEQEIIGIAEGSRVDFELRFFRPFESTEAAYMTTESLSADTTKVVWGFDGRMKYPMNLMLLFMDFESMIGADLQTGLDNLKSILEKQ